ncbi:MAG TPA: hypothetical protein VII69_01140 [Candidatus Eremiobacteraceae bacterium]
MNPGSGQLRAVCVALVATTLTLAGSGAAWAAVLSPQTTLRLAGGAYLHLYALPLGLAPGAIVGDAAFDASGTRAVFVVVFPGSAVFGDPQRMDPTQAFLLDVPRLRLTQLSIDGVVRSVRWTGSDSIEFRDGDDLVDVNVSQARVPAPSTFRFSTDQSVRGDLTAVSPETSDRLTVYRQSDGRFVAREIGARRLRVTGVAPGGRFALLGENLAWVDSHANGSATMDRAGASDALAPRFDDAFGRQLVAIHPLASTVYQGAYRDGTAYFAFSHGLTRVVAATHDLVSYFYPPMPDDPAYSVGDGLGALDDGGLFLAWPENLLLTVRRGGRFVTLQMRMPPGYSDPKRLLSSLASSAHDGQAALWPPLQPDAGALDSALLQWRVYPAGQGSNSGWIASYLGRVYRGDSNAVFTIAQPPVFPFAVLTRSDDGTLWGASPVSTSSAGVPSAGVPSTGVLSAGVLSTRASIARPGPTVATLWASGDGSHWHVRYALDGSPGAVGADQSGLWVALTKSWRGTSMICIAALGDESSPVSYPTGGSYDGEQMFFARLSSGTYLVWGATPGRSQADQGALSAFRLDATALFAMDGAGLNAYTRVRAAGDSGTSATESLGDPAMLEKTVRELESSTGDRLPALATNISGAKNFASSATIRSLAGERVWQAEFGAQPLPLGVVTASIDGDFLVVVRSVWSAPLRGHGDTERWQRDNGGAWHLTQTLRAWSF